ncbi:MAG: hypothetical protein J7L51_02910 [Desulfurococcales archaeon]|nr:hypothetical protein [Desulfurococcales archaeon]
MGYTMTIEGYRLEAGGLREVPAVGSWGEMWEITEEGRLRPKECYFRWDDSFEDFLSALARAGVTGEVELSGEQAEWYKYVLRDGEVTCHEGWVIYPSQSHIYEFYWGHHDDERFLMEVEAEPEEVERLLEEYRASDEEYDDEGWLEFLRGRGIRARTLRPERSIQF